MSHHLSFRGLAAAALTGALLTTGLGATLAPSLADSGTASAAAAATVTPTATQSALIGAVTAPDTTAALPFLRTLVAAGGLSQSAYDAIASLPATSLTHSDSKAGLSENGLQVLGSLRAAIDPTQYSCETTDISEATKDLALPQGLIDEWVQLAVKAAQPGGLTATEQARYDELLKWIGNVLALAFVHGFDVPTYDTLVHPNDARFQTFGTVKGDVQRDTQLIRRTTAAVDSFWDIPSRHLTLSAMKSTLFESRTDADLNRIGVAVVVAAGDASGELGDINPAGNAATLALGKAIVGMVDNVPWLDGGSSPIFTFNAFAFDPIGYPDFIAKWGNQVVYGDGLLKIQNQLGYTGVGPAVVIGHEFGHQIQYQNGVFDGVTPSPEATRRTELMADAYGSYFAAHKGGLTYNAKRVAETSKVFWGVGDCGFTDNGHHGTPAQRERTSLWASGLAAGQKPKNVIGTKALQAQFDAKLPELVAPDAH
ncbi:hypothetical protein [Nocardioides sp.]|uniref:hypothetical protein n=1 Tax=Nocardioides sp. TaxID=35761 RepID=UPI002626E7CE|nr:hypothetical protein [Nocardioides sp.]